MKASYILPLLITFILLIVSGCREEETAFRHQLDEAEVLMRTDAQSAFRQLCDLNDEAEKQEKALRMRHLLLRCNAQNKADSLFSADSECSTCPYLPFCMSPCPQSRNEMLASQNRISCKFADRDCSVENMIISYCENNRPLE